MTPHILYLISGHLSKCFMCVRSTSQIRLKAYIGLPLYSLLYLHSVTDLAQLSKFSIDCKVKKPSFPWLHF